MVIPCYVSLLTQTYPHPLLPRFAPTFLLMGASWKPPAAHLGCTPSAQLKGHVFACSSGPFPMKQSVCLTSLSRLSRRDWRVCLLFFAFNTVLLLLTQSVPWLWDNLRSCIEKLYAAFRVHHCRQIYTPQKMTGPLAWRSHCRLDLEICLRAILGYGDGWILIPTHCNPRREGNSILSSIFISPNSLGCLSLQNGYNK